jgi:rubrerythrin
MMPLENFGSILSFAAEMESLDHAYYSSAARNPSCTEYKEIFEQFATDEKKNEQTVLRTRRENVTEMILEPIRNFTRDPFVTDREGAETMSLANVLDTAGKIEERAENFYTQAADKVRALPEVSRALKILARKRAAHKERLATK